MSLNKVILIGRLGADPKIAATSNGITIANINLATSSKWKNKKTGELQENTEWHRVVFFERLAEVAGQYLKKGSQVYIEGRLQTRKWQDSNGNDCYTTEIVASEMQMLGGKSDAVASEPTSQSKKNPVTTKESNPAYQPSYTPSDDDFGDDIPF